MTLALREIDSPLRALTNRTKFTYDRRNRLASWKNGTATHAYGFDDLGNLTNNDGSAQSFNAATRPHAIQSRANGNATYAHDADGNVTSIVAPGSARHFKFDSANRMVCADSVPGGCGANQVHYDVDGRRVLDDDLMAWHYQAFVDGSVSFEGGIMSAETRIEIHAFGERIAYKRSAAMIRTAGVELPFGVPPAVLELLAGLAFLGLLAGLAKQGVLVLVVQRPGYAGVSAILVVVLVLGPIPGVRVSRAGGGGGASFYWELADPLGTGMVMLDETGARRVHRTYTPFGVQDASVGPVTWLLRRYAGHARDEDSGLVYMQARWMDPDAGTFLSVDPVVSSPTDPQTLNAYSYARNNPVSNTDPTGACIMADCGYWYGRVPAGMSLSQVANGYAADPVGNSSGFSSGTGGSASGIAQVADDSHAHPRDLRTDPSQSGAAAGTAGAGAGANQGGGFWSGVGAVLGKVWSLPNTALGLAIGLPALALSGVASLGWNALHVASFGRFGSFGWVGVGLSFGNNAIQFTNFPLGGAGEALTLGNVQIYPRGSNPTASFGFYYGSNVPINLGLHEQGHTLQAQVFGPLFLPAYFLSGGISASNPFEQAANSYALGGSFLP